MPGMPGSILGNAVRRVEDPELLRGQGAYTDDLHIHPPAGEPLDGLAYAVFVRSPVAHARIAGVDVGEAATAPGVLAVFTAGDLGDRPVPPFATVNSEVPRPALSGDKVRYVGDPVALVVAETAAVAADAAELVDVDYDDLPAVADMEAALAPDAPLQFEHLGSNIATAARADGPDPLEGAEVVIRLRMENQRVAVAPIEPNALLVRPRAEGDPSESPALTVWVATQQPHLARDLIARYTDLDPAQVRVVAPHVGGAFGGKAGITYGHAAVIAAARRLGRPVAWTETRSEAMLSMTGRGQVQYAELGLTRDGAITGLRGRIVGDCGAYAGFGGALAVGPTRMMAQGPYEIPRVRVDAIAAMTNTPPNGAFRGAGRPEATAMLERVLDLAADELGLAPEEIRRRNLIPPDRFPYRTRTGATYDVADFDLPLREALRVADVDGVRREQARRREAGETRLLGVGVATYVEITGFGGTELGSVAIDDEGRVTVSAGTSAHGQGHATSFAMIVADRLGVPMDRITYVQSDTARVRSGGGTGGSRSLQLGGSAVATAAAEVYDRAAALAADLLEAPVGDIVAGEDGLGVAGVPDAGVTWAEVARHAADRGEPLAAELDVPQEGATFPFGAHVSVVEVDTETGKVIPLRHVAVDDCGRILNPLIVAGQQHGGVVQGISQALWEHLVFDADGQPMTSSFADYAIPTAADALDLEVSNTETPTPLNRLGAKGIGESGSIGATPAVQNAVVDALSHLGVRHVDLPCTPQRVWAAIRDAGRTDPWREPPAAFDDLPEGDSEAADIEA